MQHAGPSADLESMEMTPPVLENAVGSSSRVGGHRGALSRVGTSEQLDDAPLFRSCLESDEIAHKAMSTAKRFSRPVFSCCF